MNAPEPRSENDALAVLRAYLGTLPSAGVTVPAQVEEAVEFLSAQQGEVTRKGLSVWTRVRLARGYCVRCSNLRSDDALFCDVHSPATRAAVKAEALREMADEVDELLQSFIVTDSANSPAWDKAQARMVAHIERLLRQRADELE